MSDARYWEIQDAKPSPLCEERDPEQFFPEGRGADIRIQLAQAVCNRGGEGATPCPLREACLEIAMKAEGMTGVRSRWGIYGGKTPEERVALARRRYRERARAEAQAAGASPATQASPSQ